MELGGTLAISRAGSEFNDTKKTGPYAELSLMGSETDPIEAVPPRHMSTENLFFFLSLSGCAAFRWTWPSDQGIGQSGLLGLIRGQALRGFHARGLHATRTSFASDPHAGSTSVLKASRHHHRNVSYRSVDTANVCRFLSVCCALPCGHGTEIMRASAMRPQRSKRWRSARPDQIRNRDTGRYFCSFGTRRGNNRKTSSVVALVRIMQF